MAQQPTDADYRNALETAVDGIVDAVRNRDERTYEPYEALSEAVFEEADEYLAYTDVDVSITVLQSSPNEPEEWEPFAEGKDDWEEVVQSMAFTVVRQDIYDALEREGYLDAHWNPTPKLVGEAEADA